MSEIKINPVNEEELEDKRNQIAENIFIELDIVTKAYAESFGEDKVYEELEFLTSNVAFLLRSHKNDHTLYNIDISKLKIPNSRFVDDNNQVIDVIYMLNPMDKTTYFINLLMNSKLGLIELQKSSYFDEVDDGNNGFLIPISKVLSILYDKIDVTVLRMNVILNKL